MPSKSTLYRQKLKETDPAKYEEYLEGMRNRASARRATAKAKAGTLTRTQEAAHEAELEKRRERDAKRRAEKGMKVIGPRRTLEPGEKWPKDMTADERREYDNKKRQKSRANMSGQKKRRYREKQKNSMRKRRAFEKMESSATLDCSLTASPFLASPFSTSTPNSSIPTSNTPPTHPPAPIPTSNTPPTHPPAPIPTSNTPPTHPPAPIPSPNTPPTHLPAPIPTPNTHPSVPVPLHTTPQKKKYKKKTVYNIKYKIKNLFRKMSPKTSANVFGLIASPKTPDFKAEYDRIIVEKLSAKRALFKSKSPDKKRQAVAAEKAVKNAARQVRQRCVKEHYLREDVSRPLPHERYSTKHGAAHVMNVTIKGAWRQFCVENPSTKMGLTTFYNLRPKNVKKLGSVPAETCVCLYCFNIKYKLDALNRVMARHCLPRLPSEHKILDLICCEEEEDSKNPECVFGTCRKCRDSLRSIKPLTVSVENEVVNWSRWERGEDTRLDVFIHSGTVKDLLEGMRLDIDDMSATSTFRQHIYTAHWQYRAARDLKFVLPKGTCFIIEDFAENRKASYGVEVKGVHFGKKQITLHPIVAHFKDSKGQLVRHVLMFLSDDIKHDYHAVQHFNAIAIKHLQAFMTIKRLIIFSDGCGGQYKGKGSFGDLSLMKDFQVERCYYGSEHGKGEADGATGIFAQEIRRAVLGQKLNFANAAELHSWASDNLRETDECKARLFFLVKEGEICRERPESEVKTLPGTRGYHQVQRVDDYVLRCRRLACFCSGCAVGRPECCVNLEQVGHWVVHTLKRKTTPETQPLPTSVPSPSPSAELLTSPPADPLPSPSPGPLTSPSPGPSADPLTSHSPGPSAAPLPSPSPSSDAPDPKSHFPVGAFLEVHHLTERQDMQVFKCMVIDSDLCSREGDMAVQYLTAHKRHHTLHPDIYIINMLDENVSSIRELDAPSITARRHYIF